MRVDRSIARAKLTGQIAAEAALLKSCIGCRDCRGLCQPLIEVLTLPQAVLDRQA